MRLARAYADGACGDSEYATRRKSIDEQSRAAADACAPSRKEEAALFADMPALWDRADHGEWQRLLEPPIERVYLDIDSGLIGGITPTPGFRVLLEHALERAESSRVVILGEQDITQNVELLEMGSSPSPVTLHASFLLPHSVRGEWNVLGLAWRPAA